GDELVAVDAAVDDQAGGGDRPVAAAFRQALGVQWDLEGAGHLEAVDRDRRHTALAQLGQERVAALVDDLPVPARLHEGDPPVAPLNVALHHALLSDRWSPFVVCSPQGDKRRTRDEATPPGATRRR